VALHILVINSGSSSIKFSIFEAGRPWPLVLFTGEISGMGGATLGFTFHDAAGHELSQSIKQKSDPVTLLEQAVTRPGMPPIDAVGYRVVHPGALLNRHLRIT
jgi:acetate kinase